MKILNNLGRKKTNLKMSLIEDFHDYFFIDDCLRGGVSVWSTVKLHTR